MSTDRKSEQYVRQSQEAAANIATWPTWMQRNLKPTTVTVECPSRVILDTAQCDLEPGHDGPHRFGEHITWADADELPTGAEL